MTPQQSNAAHQDPASKQRIGEEVADVLLYLLQVADHCEIDVALAVKDKLARNALKYPAKRTIARVSPARSAMPGTHVLLDYENVQPTEDELRAMVPDASRVWVFHGPHQRQVEQRFASFGADVTAVPISKTGKNALDFHLCFYLGYIASQNSASPIVVVANDKGYEPMLEHARAMDFAVRQLGHGRSKPSTSVKATPAAKAGATAKPAAKKTAAKKAPAKKAATKQLDFKQVPAKKAAATKTAAAVPVATKAPAGNVVPAKKVVAKRANLPTARKVAVAGLAEGAPVSVPLPTSSSQASASSVSHAVLLKITYNLRKMGDKRPVKPVTLRRALKSFLGAETADDSIEVALDRLIAAGVVSIGTKSDVSYPGFAPSARVGVTQV